jgi:hypothetical protein
MVYDVDEQVYHLSKQLREEQALRVKQAKVIDKHVERWKSLKQAARKKKVSSFTCNIAVLTSRYIFI